MNRIFFLLITLLFIAVFSTVYNLLTCLQAQLLILKLKHSNTHSAFRLSYPIKYYLLYGV